MKLLIRARDKPVLSYRTSRAQMGDLLMGCGDLIGKLCPWKKKRLQKRLERYMPSVEAYEPIKLDIGLCFLTIQGADEAGHLYNNIIERMN